MAMMVPPAPAEEPVESLPKANAANPGYHWLTGESDRRDVFLLLDTYHRELISRLDRQDAVLSQMSSRSDSAWRSVGISKAPVARRSGTGEKARPRSSQVFDRYVRSLPSLEEAYASGVPLATPLEDVDRLEGLPRLGGVAQMVHGVRVGLARDLAQYNSEASKSGHEQLSFDDALWGAVMVRTRGFSCGDGTSALAPVADLVNHSYLPNARWTCDSGTDAKLTLISKAEIPPGEEILINYKAQSNPGAEAYLKTYGFIEGARPVVWPAAECSKLRAANLQGRAPLLDAARRLVAEKCVPKPVDTPLLVQMMPILSEPPPVSKRRLRSFL